MSQTDPEMTHLAHEFERALLSLDRVAARQILIETSSSGSTAERIDRIVVPALQHIGQGWETGQVALSQIYVSGRICEDLVSEILPPGDPARKSQPKMAIAVLEDHHLLGKRIVHAVLRASGFDLLDYGHGISVPDLVRRTLADQVQILLISTLMLRSALRIKEVTTQLAAAGATTRVVVGGAPFRFDTRLWQEVGAHAMGCNAAEAVVRVQEQKEAL